MLIRKIQPKDDAQVAYIIRMCLTEYGADHRPDTAWADPYLDHFSAFYATLAQGEYWVAELDGTVVAGVGIGPMAGADGVCELQKMYCLAPHRGKGIAAGLLQIALQFAARYYHTCYLETMDTMWRARRFYEKFGFTHTAQTIGATGHGGCNYHYIKSLSTAFPTLADVRACEEAFTQVFSRKFAFSPNLDKWQDDALPDKYDNNYFEYSAPFTQAEFDAAVAYQKAKGDAFVKFIGHQKLPQNYGMEEGKILTMLYKNFTVGAHICPNLTIKPAQMDEALAIELKHYGATYGEDFTRRNMEHEFEKLHYMGAYLDGKMVGCCYYWTDGKCTCIDGVLVDEAYRKRGIAATLLLSLSSPNTFLHADADDTPKDLYARLGYEVVDETYEYFLDLSPKQA